MKYTTIVFDCDGTLLDTSTDLYNSVNYVLRKHNFPERSMAEVKANLANAGSLFNASLLTKYCGQIAI